LATYTLPQRRLGQRAHVAQTQTEPPRAPTAQGELRTRSRPIRTFPASPKQSSLRRRSGWVTRAKAT